MSLISSWRAYLSQAFGSDATTRGPVNDPATPTTEPPKSRYRLDNESSEIFILPDGRKLGYAQYGSLTGRAIFYLHGHPGSRLEAARFDDMALELGARIIAADRPGMGWSSPHPGSTLLDHAKDLEQLAKHLGLSEYGALGISGGGPYALACAMGLPREQLKCVSIICGMGPPDIGMKGARLSNWVGFTFGYRIATVSGTRWFWQREIVGRLDLTDEERLKLLVEREEKSRATAHPKDIEVQKDPDFLRLLVRSNRESFAQGYEGVLQDGKLMSTDFGFKIEDIRPDLPVQLWYGRDDVCVPLNHGIQIAARLGDRARLRVEDETHASITVNYEKEALKDLLGSMQQGTVPDAAESSSRL